MRRVEKCRLSDALRGVMESKAESLEVNDGQVDQVEPHSKATKVEGNLGV